jgi:hypothetical protein
LAEFRHGSLQELQTLLHLRRESLLLRDSRDEFHSCHHLKGDDATREGKQLLGQFYTFMQKALQKLLGDTPPLFKAVSQRKNWLLTVFSG